MEKFGGELRFTLSTGRAIVVRGEIEVMPSGRRNEGVVNQNGSVSQVATLVARRFRMKFEDAADLDWDEIMCESDLNATIVEDHAGTVHTLTSGFFEGEPTINRNNGEVSGLEFVTNAYRKAAA